MLVRDKDSLSSAVRTEKLMNHFTYKSMRMGSLISKHIYLRDKLSLQKVLKSILFDVLYYLKRIRFKVKINEIIGDKIGIVYYSNRYKDIRFVEAVEQSFGKKNTVRIYSKHIDSKISISNIIKSLTGILLILKVNSKALERLEFEVNGIEKLFLRWKLFHETFRSDIIREQLMYYFPEQLIFTYDRRYNSIFVEIANSIQCNTYTLIHGSTFHLPTGYVPNIAQKVLVWGSLQKEMFIEYGTAEKDIAIVGHPCIDVPHIPQRQHIDNQKKKLFVLISSPPKGTSETQFVSRFLNNFQDLKEVELRVKLHPTTHDKNSVLLKKKHPNVFIYEPNTTIHDIFESGDVFFGLNSTMLLEAALYGKNVAVFNPLQYTEQSIGSMLVEKCGAVQLHNENIDSLKSELDKAPLDTIFRFRQVQEGLQGFIAFTGEKSLENIKKEVLNNE